LTDGVATTRTSPRVTFCARTGSAITNDIRPAARIGNRAFIRTWIEWKGLPKEGFPDVKCNVWRDDARLLQFRNA
jgi:hypothetical protein